MKYLLKYKLHYFSLFVIFVLFMSLRLFNIERRILFDWDQERDAMAIYELIVNYKPSLIGPRVFGPEGFFLGPYFTYILTPFYIATRLHPYATIGLIIFYNLFFFYIAYRVTAHLFNKSTAVLVLMLWAVNPVLIAYDMSPWNPLLIPLGTFTIWYFLYKAYHKPTAANSLLLGATTGLFFHFHFQFIFIFFTSLISLGFLSFSPLYKKNIHRLKLLLVYTAGWAATFIPIVLFDIRHDWLNARAFVRLFFFSKEITQHTISIWLPVFENMFKPILMGLPGLLFVLTLPVVTYLYAKRNNKHSFYYFFFYWQFILLVLTYIGFTVYGKRPSEYYFTYLYPLFFILLALLCQEKHHIIRLIALIVIVLSLITNSITAHSLTKKSSSRSLYHKNKTIEYLKQRQFKRPFQIAYETDPGLNTGFNYLVRYYQLNVTTDIRAPMVHIVVPALSEIIRFGDIGIRIPPELKP